MDKVWLRFELSPELREQFAKAVGKNGAPSMSSVLREFMGWYVALTEDVGFVDMDVFRAGYDASEDMLSCCGAAR